MECKNFQDTFQTRQRIFISAFSICMTVSLWWNTKPLSLHYRSTGFKIVNIWLIIIKDPHCRTISGLAFPVFGLNTEIYGVKRKSQSKYRKIRTRNNSVLGHFSRAVWIFDYYQSNIYNFKSTAFVMQAQWFCVSP